MAAKKNIVNTKTNARSLDTKLEDKWLVSRHKLVDTIMTLTTPIWDSKAKKLKPKMTIAQACSEVWISSVTYHWWLKEDAVLAQMVEEVHNSHRQMMEDMANSIIMEGLNGDVKLRPSEKIGFAFRYLEKTSPYFNPSQKIELEATNTNNLMTEEEIINRLKELSQETWNELLIPNTINQEDVNFTQPDITEEPARNEEADGEEVSGNGWTTPSWD